MMKISEMIFGRITFVISGFELESIADSIYKCCKVDSLYAESDALYATVNYLNQKKLINLLDDSDVVYNIIERKGLSVYLSKYLKRFGLIFGAFAAAILVFLLSNVVLKIEINGTDDTALKASIIGVLKGEGITPGAYLTADDFMELESKLCSITDKIAWVSIGREGSLITVNVSESTNKTSYQSKRIPTNIVAARDGVIVDAEVLTGKLSVLIGSAVSKGELLVSGIVERRNGRAYYYHSIARITAEFEENIEVHQDLVCEENTVGDVIYTRGIKFFDLELELPSLRKLSGNYSKESDLKLFRVFDVELPIGIVSNKYSQIISDVKVYTAESAIEELYERLETIEKSILADNEIIAREIEEIFDENGITLKAKYTLRGEIGVQSEIFAN